MISAPCASIGVSQGGTSRLHFSDSQTYVRAAQQELGIYELRPDALVQREVVQWHGLLASIEVSAKPLDQPRSPVTAG
ncbi:MAG: hypothetical protein V3R72_05335 [Gammaproteobacteria bacterium]